MTSPISHEGDEPLIFNALNGFTCSICAPNSTVKAEIEAFAETKFPGVWESINKASMGLGQPTGGWPGYHTHFTTIAIPELPSA